MNEYIVHNENGYLYDFRNPSKIDLSDLPRIRKNAYATIADGFAQWQETPNKINDWISEAPRPAGNFLMVYRELGISADDSPAIVATTLPQGTSIQSPSLIEGSPVVTLRRRTILDKLGGITLGEVLSWRFWKARVRNFLSR
jgi:hypothetical protein